MSFAAIVMSWWASPTPSSPKLPFLTAVAERECFSRHLAELYRQIEEGEVPQRCLVPTPTPLCTWPRGEWSESLRSRIVDHFGLQVTRWLSVLRGKAIKVSFRWGGGVRYRLHVPRSRGPLAAAIFLHEVGHCVVGFTGEPRVMEELRAWLWAFDALKRLNLPIPEVVVKRYHASMRYEVRRAMRRRQPCPPFLRFFLNPQQPERGVVEKRELKNSARPDGSLHVPPPVSAP